MLDAEGQNIHEVDKVEHTGKETQKYRNTGKQEIFQGYFIYRELSK